MYEFHRLIDHLTEIACGCSGENTEIYMIAGSLEPCPFDAE